MAAVHAHPEGPWPELPLTCMHTVFSWPRSAGAASGGSHGRPQRPGVTGREGACAGRGVSALAVQGVLVLVIVSLSSHLT